MMTSTNGPHILVVGDQTIDWAVIPETGFRSADSDDRLAARVKLYWHKGGIFAIAKMLNDSPPPGSTGDIAIRPNLPSPDSLTPYDSGYNYSFAMLRGYGTNEKSKPYRISNHLGFLRSIKPAQQPYADIGTPSIVVIADCALGFRDDPYAIWESISHLNPKPWIVLKMSYAIAKGDLWKLLEEELAKSTSWLHERLVTLTTATRLREAGASISRDRSWDLSVKDVVREIRANGEGFGLNKLPHLIVSFGPTGALWLDHYTEAELVHNSRLMAGEWAAENNKGMMFGYGMTMCASVAREILRADSAHESPEYIESIKGGLYAMQDLYNKGFHLDEKEPIFELPKLSFAPPDQDNPIISDKVTTDKSTKKVCSPLMGEPDKRLEDRSDYLIKVALQGSDAITKGPIARFGNLVAVESSEIKSLHTFYNLVENYCGNDDISLKRKPLAIAVFGEPGSGKGYVIEQLVEPWTKRHIIQKLEYNLSQFNSASDLVGAMHEIRDVALAGKVPLVLWDEFDTPLNNALLGWLRYFLAPIQDGKFQQEESSHLIGPSIFVFAGGTFPNYRSFRSKVDRDASPESKATDFASRLRGHMDIDGINPKYEGARPGARLMLRRALVFHSLMHKHEVARTESGDFDVDLGILCAFLEVHKYRHDVRSMEAIIQMSRRQNKQRFGESDLPSRDQLDMHVETGEEFLKIVHSHPERRREPEVSLLITPPRSP
ncbi:hypothetical protein ACFV0O_28680 [Kitasatospora sp. NPDC059577]|uniref:hypothetical protein n=1 Tax=Kitasatospora sp. NPDC059577 TaxID=3346873 RepID=UPI0036A0CDC9